MAPIAWPMEEVAARLVGTVEYLFREGSILRDGETLGVSNEERFRIRHDKTEGGMILTLEHSRAAENIQ